jgi:hypothetical protein
MKKISTLTLTLGLALLLAAGAWAYVGWSHYGGMMYSGGYHAPGWHMGWSSGGAPVDGATAQDGAQDVTRGYGYCPAWGQEQRGGVPGTAPDSGPATPGGQS